MTRMGRHAVGLFLCLLACAPGCNTHNPSYFPYLLPFGDVVPAHAKPPGSGYYANFDPHAVRLEVRPLKDATGQDVTNQTRTQHVLIATVYDEKGQPRRDRRVEWMIEGAGHIIEVDESGYLAGRGFKTSDKHGVSYTNRNENRLSRGDKNRENDYMIRPGQTWCVLSSAVEGDTHVTVFAPGIADWEKNKVYTTVRWVDAIWEFPQPAQKAAGTDHVFTTRLFRATTKQPLANYRVRYRIKDGPAAYFLPDKSQEFTATSDLSGNADARIAQVRLGDQLPPAGVNNIEIEVVRPPDPTAPSGSGVVIARGTTSIEWLAPNVQLSYTGPPAALVNEEVTYTATLQNLGKVPSEGISLTAPIPRGMDFVRSVPPAMGNVQGEMLFTLGSLPPGGQSANVQLTFKARELGPTSSSITMRTGGQTDRKEVPTTISDARLAITIEGAQRASVGQVIPLTIKVTNTGGGVLNAIQLKAELKGGLVDPSGLSTLNQTLKNPLAPGQTYSDVLNVIPKAKGRAECQVFAVTGTVNGNATHVIEVTEPTVSLLIDGPKKKYVGRNAEFTIRVTNPTDAPLNNVLVRDQLPPELDFVTAQDGQLTGREVVWNLGTLAAGQTRDLKLVARCRDKTPRAENRVVVTSDNTGLANQAWDLEIFGAPGLRLEMRDIEDPVPVGGKAVYEIVVTNTGTENATGVNIAGEIAGGLARILEGTGPTQINIVGNKFTFQPTTLKPNERAVFRVNVQAGDREMDGVFRCLLAADTLQSPVVEDENTKIFVPRGPIGGGQPGVNPGPPGPNNLPPPPSGVGIPPVPPPPSVPMFP